MQPEGISYATKIPHFHSLVLAKKSSSKLEAFTCCEIFRPCPGSGVEAIIEPPDGDEQRHTNGKTADSKSTDTRTDRPSDIGTGQGAQQACEKDAGDIFKEAASGSNLLSLDGLRKAVAIAEYVVSETELQQLFSELDKDGDGTITHEEFIQGWNTTPFVGSLDTLLSLLRSPDFGLMERLAAAMLKRLRARTRSKMDIQLLLRELQSHDLRQAWKDSEDTVVEAFERELQSVHAKEHSALTAHQLNDKFADQTFEATYKDMPEFMLGVEGSLGLPGQDIFGGIKMEFCHSEDSKCTFTASNYGGTTSTPEEEYNFVRNPVVGQPMIGGRTGTPLEVFLYAASAKKANSQTEEMYDTPLSELDEGVRGGVKAVLLRRAKEVGLTQSFLAAAAEQDQQLASLAASSAEKLECLKRAMADALNQTDKEASTGQPCFERLAETMEKSGLEREVLEALLERMRESLKEAGLAEEEVLALRLYTGPPFVKLNGTLRAGDKAESRGGTGNQYVCTIFAAISGMVKLANASPIPAGRVVYRGQRGMRLPQRFWKADAQGVKGGVELAFLSTTTEIEVAIGYAAEGALPTVFAIQTGAVDKGAALGFLSQYPEEAEILMPPRSFMEVVGRPSVLTTARGVVLQIPVKINCNLQCPLLEKLRESRKTMLVSMLEHVRKEVARDVDASMQTERVQQRLKNHLDTSYAYLTDSIKKEPVQVLRAARERPSRWYNEDRNFRLAMLQALEVQRMSMGKFELWIDDADSTISMSEFVSRSARDCDKMAAARLRRRIGEAKTSTKEKAEVRLKQHREAALQLCKHLELVHTDVDEILETSGGETALMKHAAEDHGEAVSLLLAAGANPEAQRPDGMTALTLTAQYGLTDIARRLVHEGGAQNHDALTVAAKEGHEGVFTWLVETGGADVRGENYRSVLMKAAKRGHEGVVKYLVAGVEGDVDASDDDGNTALMSAAEAGHAGIVNYLMETGGANIQAVDASGNTALMMAASGGHETVVKCLVESGVEHVDAKNEEGETAVMMAALGGHESTVKCLVEAGRADLSTVDKYKSTVLMMAASSGHEGVVKLLVERGVDVNVADEGGCTALMIAAFAEECHAGVVRCLVEAGEADVHTVSKAGQTALMLAALRGHEGIVRCLMEAGGAEAMHATNNGGQTAAMLAASSGHNEIVKYLEEAEGAPAGAHSADTTGTTDVTTAGDSEHAEVISTITSRS